jgi:hypothetical protein
MIITLFSITSCSKVEDTNGLDNYSIETFSDDEIINGAKFTYTFGQYTSSSEWYGNLTGKYKVLTLSGVSTIVAYDTANEIIYFEIECTCEKGNALVAVVSNDRIIKKIQANETINFEISNNGYSYRIVVVGESAKMTVKYTVESYSTKNNIS